MRRLFRRVGTRTGVSLVLVVVVATTVLVARLIDDRRAVAPYRGPAPVPTVHDTEGDDSADDEEPTAYPDDARVLSVAQAFAEAWLRPDLTAQEWLEGLRPHATDALIAKLIDVDPSEVPANADLGEPEIQARTESHAEVRIPIAPHDALALGLVGTERGWLVATLDRETG